MTTWSLWQAGSGGGGSAAVYYVPISIGFRRHWRLMVGASQPWALLVIFLDFVKEVYNYVHT